MLMLSTWIIGLKAQESVPVTGGNALGVGGSISYSIGQIAYTTNSGSEGYVSQGVQQPYEITAVTEIKTSKGITLEFSASPNPSTDYVLLKIQNFKAERLSYELHDINGKLLKSNKIESDETNIEMKKYIRSVYFLKIIDQKAKVKEFKIIKN